jgi:hypothetical protein
MTTARRGLPSFASSTLIAIGVALLVLGVVLTEVRRSVLTPDGLSARAGAALADPRVSAFVAGRATDAVLAAQPDLTAFRPIVAAVANSTVASPPFQRAVQVSLRSAVAAVMSGRTSTIALSIPDLGVLMRSALSQANPALAERIPARVRDAIGVLEKGTAAKAVVDLLRLSRRLAGLALVLLVCGAIGIAVGVGVAADRRRAILDASIHTVSAAVVLLVLRAAGGWFLQTGGTDEASRAALAGVWVAFTSGLRGWALMLAFVGLITAASAHSMLERLSLADAASGLRHLLQDPPGGAWGRMARSALLVGVGAAAIGSPGAFLEWTVLAVGGALVFVGVREALGLLRSWATSGESAAASGARGPGLRRVALVGAATVLAALGAIALLRPAAPVIASAAGLCNGSAELCDRPLNEATFAGAHNAMSAADVPGWMFPQHERGLTAQLTDGIRAFLIDVHYGRPAASAVVTDLDAETTSRAKIEEAVGPEGVEAALRIRTRFAGGDLGARGIYLCHGFCELGAQPLGPWLATLADFLAQHPDEVVVLVIEDYVSPGDLAGEFEKAGLADQVYRGSGRAPWASLRTLIDTRQRVVVMTESGRPGVPWLLPAFEVMQETPYKFRNPSELSCAANRGGTQGSLLLVNNWIDTTPAPKPSNAALVNAHDALLARARLCWDERRVKPTILAVDFYRTGDVVGVARAMNE